MPDVHSPPPLVDIGANLGHESFTQDLPDVLEDACAAGVRAILVTGTSVDASARALELAQAHPGYLFSTAGIHPHDATGLDAHSQTRLADLAAHPEVRALGEMGLDFNRDFSPRPLQEKAFEAQLELACDVDLPLFLHQRDAHAAFLKLLSRYRHRLGRCVVHCFTGTEDELLAYLDLDCHIGLTGWICDERRGAHLHDFVTRIPLERLMLETDSPYLLPRNITPKPKSRRNEPRYLPWVLRALAEIFGMDETSLARQTSANAKGFFNLPVSLAISE